MSKLECRVLSCDPFQTLIGEHPPHDPEHRIGFAWKGSCGHWQYLFFVAENEKETDAISCHLRAIRGIAVRVESSHLPKREEE